MKQRVRMSKCAGTEKSCGAVLWLRWRRRRSGSVSRLRKRQPRMARRLAEASAAGKERRGLTTMALKTCPRITCPRITPRTCPRITPRLPRLSICPIVVHGVSERSVTEKCICSFVLWAERG